MFTQTIDEKGGGYAVAIHGCHLQADEWRNIVFGEEEKWGRVPTGVLAALEHQATLVYWGTGASSIDTPSGKMLEGEYTFSQSLGPELEKISARVGKSAKELHAYLSRVSVVNRDSKNTAEEVSAAIRECQARGIKNLILVSSPTHIARCLQTACIFAENARNQAKRAAAQLAKAGSPEELRHLREEAKKADDLYKSIPAIYARPSETCYAGAKAKDIVIFEPKHRADTPRSQSLIYALAKRAIPLREKWDRFERNFI